MISHEDTKTRRRRLKARDGGVFEKRVRCGSGAAPARLRGRCRGSAMCFFNSPTVPGLFTGPVPKWLFRRPIA
jgi:hypothetical protein